MMPPLVRDLAKRSFLTSNTLRYAVEQPRLEEALTRLGRPIRTLLDAGAGGGHYAVHCYLPRCERLIAVEYERRNYEILRQALAPFGERVQARQGSVAATALPAGSVDCVACTQVLEHIADDAGVAAEFARVLAVGGHLLVTVPQPPAPWPEGDHVREGYTLAQLEALFAPHGLRLRHADWFLTEPTQRLIKLSHRLRGFLPRVVSLRELRVSAEERRRQRPYGLLGWFCKEAASAAMDGAAKGS